MTSIFSKSSNANILVASFVALVYRYSGQDEILVEFTGFSPATLKFDLSQDPDFESVLEQLKFLTWDPYAPAAWVQAGGFGEEFLSGNRLRQNAVNLRLRLDRTATGIQWCFEETEKRLDGSILSALERHLGRYQQEAAAQPASPISEIDFLAPEEVEFLVQRWVGPQRAYADRTISEIFEQVAGRNPDHCALIQGRQRLSYGELNAMANRLARYLRLQGVTTETPVGLFLEQSIDAVVSIIAILKAGGAYVPLDLDHPKTRLSEIIDDAELNYLITNSECASELPFGSRHIIVIDDEQVQIEDQDSTNFPSGCNSASLAYILFTSGSSGKPQGVLGIHRSITNGLWEAQFDAGDPNEVSCLNAPLSVGISLLLLFLPLMSRVPLVVLTRPEIRDPQRLAEIIAAHGVTTIGVATPVLRLWLDPGSRATKLLGCLHSVMVGGAPLTPDLVKAFELALPGARLENGYGSTEMGSIAARGLVSNGGVAVSKPVTNTTLYLLDRHGRPVPSLGTGEIHIASGHLARGYLNRPALTDSRFVRDPFQSSPSRMFKTGDLARDTPAGILILGRSDDQVKIRGFRVHLNEVEAALAACPGVGTVAVAARQLAGEMRLVAYYTGDSNPLPADATVRAYLRTSLPDYMVPTVVTWLPELPRTEGGKIDRGALPVPLAPETTGNPEARGGEIEAFLLDIWRSVLMIDHVVINDRFVDLGGDSLFAANITSRIWERYGLEMDLETFFDCGTVSNVASRIRQYLLEKQGGGTAWEGAVV